MGLGSEKKQISHELKEENILIVLLLFIDKIKYPSNFINISYKIKINRFNGSKEVKIYIENYEIN